jgi:hypothetical protein
MEYLVNHVFLPPKLPQEQEEEDTEEREDCLLQLLVAASKDYLSHMAVGPAKEKIGTVCNMLSSLEDIKSALYGISASVLEKKIVRMKDGGKPEKTTFHPCFLYE